MEPRLPAPYRVWTALILLAAALIILFKGILPGFERTKTLLEERSRRIAALSRRQQDLALLRKFAADFQALDAEKRSKFSLAMPARPDVALWLSSLENIASRSGVSIDILEQKAEDLSGPAPTLEFVVRVRGTYTALRSFFTLIGQNLRLTDLRDARLEAVSPNLADSIIQGNATLAIYYQP